MSSVQTGQPGASPGGRGLGLSLLVGHGTGQHGTAAWIRSVPHRILPRTDGLVALAPGVRRPQLLEARA